MLQKRDIKGLCKVLRKTGRWEEVVQASEALVEIGEDAVEPLISTLEDANRSHWLRARFRVLNQLVAQSLGRIGDARAVEPLIAVLKDPMLQWHSTEALRRIGEKDYAALEKIIERTEDLQDIDKTQFKELLEKWKIEHLKKEIPEPLIQGTPIGRDEELKKSEVARQNVRTSKFVCSECGENIVNALQPGPMDLTMRPIVARQCTCGWTCCFRCDPTYDQSENAHKCPQCGQFRSEWRLIEGEPDRWIDGGLMDQWKKDRQSDRWVDIRSALAIRCGLSMGFAEHAAKAKTWQQLAYAFTSTESTKAQPDFERLLDAATHFPAPEQHGIWITVAEKCKQQNRPAWARYAYAEAVVADPTSSSIAWQWLRLFIQDIKDPDVPTLLTAMEGFPRPAKTGDQQELPKLAAKCKALALKYLKEPTQTPLSPELVKATDTAAATGDVEQLKTLLKEDPRLVNAKYKEKMIGRQEEVRTPLHSAAKEGHARVAELLLDNGADVNARDQYGGTPLHSAATYGRAEVMRVLLARGADVNARAGSGNTPLHWAAAGLADATELLEVVKLLLASGADANARDPQRTTPLHWAARDGHLDVVRVLLDNGADINARDDFDGTPLHWAAANGRTGVVKLMLDKGADINSRNRKGATPLQLAERNRQTSVVEILRSREKT
jgi:hypothetical protein